MADTGVDEHHQAAVEIPPFRPIVEVVSSVSNVPCDEWNGLVSAGGFYTTWQWLRFAEESTGGPVGAVLIRKGAHLVAGRPFWSPSGHESALHNPAAVLGTLATPTRGALVASSRRSFTTGPLLRSPGLARTVAPHILDGMRTAAGDPDRTRCLLLFAETSDIATFSGLLDRRPPLLSNAEAIIAVQPDGNSGDYPVSISSRRRTQVRREERAFRESGLVAGVEKLEQCADELAALTANVEARYGANVDPLVLARQLRLQVEFCGQHDVVFTARAGGDLVAACLCYRYGPTLTVRMFGADHARTIGTFAYFMVVYYLPARWAAEHGLRELRLGIGSPKAKILRGARLEPLWSLDLDAKPYWPLEQVVEASAQTMASLPAGSLPPELVFMTGDATDLGR